MRVDHAGHQQSVGRVDYLRAVRNLEVDADGGDAVVDHEDVGAERFAAVRVVHRHHEGILQQRFHRVSISETGLGPGKRSVRR